MSERTGGASVTVDAVAERIAAARLVKVVKLAKEIRKATVTAAARLTQEEWADMAKHAGVNAPSETTQKLVVDLLREL